MQTYKKLALTMSLAIFSLALLVASASASRGIIAELGGGVGPIIATTDQSVFISDSGLRVTCRLTLRGELTTLLILKSSAGVPEGQIGKITEGRSDGSAEITLVV